MHNFDVLFCSDGTATVCEEMQQATLRNIAFGFGRVLTCSQLREELRHLQGGGFHAQAQYTEE